MDEPLGAADILVDVGLEVARHVRQAKLLVRPLQDREVELHSKLEDSELGVLNLLRCVLSGKIERNVNRVTDFKRGLRRNIKVCEGRVEQVVVIVPPGDFPDDKFLGVPVEECLDHVLLVLVSEQVANVPVTMVVPLDLLVERVLGIQL